MDEQVYWINRAVAERFSVADLWLELRTALRVAKMSQTSSDDPPTPDEGPPLTLPIVCPKLRTHDRSGAQPGDTCVGSNNLNGLSRFGAQEPSRQP